MLFPYKGSLLQFTSRMELQAAQFIGKPPIQDERNTYEVQQTPFGRLKLKVKLFHKVDLPWMAIRIG